MNKMVLFLSLAILGSPVGAAELVATDKVPLRVETIATGLENPWGLEVLPDGAYLVTERPGRMRIVKDGQVSPPLSGLPPIAVGGQGGLLDVALAHDFADSNIIFFSFSAPGPGGAGTAIGRARLVRDGSEAYLEDTQTLFSMDRKSQRGQHFGSRIAVARDGNLFFSIGDRGEGERAQDLEDHAGAILQIRPDGSIPADNPYRDDEAAQPHIWSKGHRNPQGMDFDAKTGELFAVEHGARGGDEINRPEPGKNYGWPVISYGRHYSGAQIGVGTQAQGHEQPLFYWDPSIAPGGMVVYRGSMFPEWDGDFLVTALKDQMLVRVDRNAQGSVLGSENMFEGQFGRLREVKTAPDGSLLILTDEADGSILRVVRQ